jgi:hypothetical protein
MSFAPLSSWSVLLQLSSSVRDSTHAYIHWIRESWSLGSGRVIALAVWVLFGFVTWL